MGNLQGYYGKNKDEDYTPYRKIAEIRYFGVSKKRAKYIDFLRFAYVVQHTKKVRKDLRKSNKRCTFVHVKKDEADIDKVT